AERFGRAEPGERRRLARQAGILASCLMVVPFVIWASYGYHYLPYPDSSIASRPHPWLKERLPTTVRMFSALESMRALPEAYLEGARFIAEHNAVGHPAYLLGKLSSRGWWHYYFVALLVKNTPAFLVA